VKYGFYFNGNLGFRDADILVLNRACYQSAIRAQECARSTSIMWILRILVSQQKKSKIFEIEMVVSS